MPLKSEMLVVVGGERERERKEGICCAWTGDEGVSDSIIRVSGWCGECDACQLE